MHLAHQYAEHEATGPVIESADAIQCSSPRKRAFVLLVMFRTTLSRL